VDIEILRKKQQDLMVQMVERKVRSRAQQLYETRGQRDGEELKDWFQAESEVLEKSILAPLYKRARGVGQEAGTDASTANESDENEPAQESTCSEASV
jgi:hypothetical protein